MKHFDARSGFFLLSLFCFTTLFVSCIRSTQADREMISVILVVDVKVSGSGKDPAVMTGAGSILFYSNYSYRAVIADDSLKQRICSVFGRIIAEGKAQGSVSNTGRPDLPGYPNGIPINDRNFIYALVETAERRLNSGSRGVRIYFAYR